MKSTILVFVLFSVANLKISAGHGFASKEAFKAAKDECLTENSLTMEQLKQFSKPGTDMEKLHCFNRCMMVRKGLIDKDGVIQKENIPDIVDMPFIAEDKKTEVVECIQGFDKIATCNDVTKIYGCFPKWEKH